MVEVVMTTRLLEL